MTRRGGDAEGGAAEGGSGRAGITETVDALIAHMNASRRLYMVLIAAAFVVGPASAVFAAVLLFPGIATEVGPDYELSIDFDDGIDSIGDYYGLPANHTIGGYSGSFTGKMLGHHTDEAGNLITGAGIEDGEFGVFYGEFVGEFGGERAVLTGEMLGEFTGEVHSIADEGAARGADIDDHLYYVSIGVYEGRFDGEFIGMFFGAANQTALDAMIHQGTFSDYMDGGAWSYSVSYVEGGEIAGGGGAVAADEYEPRFAAYEYGGDGVHRHTDITAAVTALVVAVAGSSAVVLYVGMREARFYRGWSERFERYVRTREAADREMRLVMGDGPEGQGGEGQVSTPPADRRRPPGDGSEGQGGEGQGSGESGTGRPAASALATVVVPGAGFERATARSSAECSPGLSYPGTARPGADPD